MKSFLSRRVLAIAVAALVLASARSASAADKALDLVPAESAFVASVNGRALFDSEAFKRVFEERSTPQVRSGLRFVEALSGLDLLKDLHEAALFVLVPHQEENGVIVRGNFDQAKLLDLLRLNETYSETKNGSYTVHQWQNPEDAHKSYGVFIQDDLLLIATSRSALDAALGVANGSGKSFAKSPSASFAPKASDELVAWAALTQAPEEAKKTFGLTGATATIELRGNRLAFSASLFLDDPALASHWADLARGLAAIPQLQRDAPTVAKLGRDAKVEKVGNNGVRLEVSAELGTLPKIREELEAMEARKKNRE
jgi:hypothetical protein